VAEVFDSLAVYGFSRDDEAVIMASLLTGEPCLLVGAPGASKTRIGRSIAKALKVKSHAYNAACDQFEDIVGLIDMKALSEGRVKYVETPVTIWGKELVSVEEINRPDATVESKWLDFFAEGTMMGVPTGVKWRFATMNPLGTVGTRELGEATLGRFSAFVFVPELANMTSGEQKAVLRTIADTNLPAYIHWKTNPPKNVLEKVDYNLCGDLIKKIMLQAADHFSILIEKTDALDRFMVRFISGMAFLTDEKSRIRIDGRRAGLLRRLILAVRAVELARANVLGIEPRAYVDSVRVAIRSGLPIGVNEEGGRSKGALGALETTITSLIGYLSDADEKILELQYEILTTNNIFRKAELLLKHRTDLSKIVKSTGWTKIASTHEFDSSLVGLMANQIEMVAPGTIPGDAMDVLTKLMNSGEIVPRHIRIPPVFVDYEPRIRALLKQKTVVQQLVATHVIAEQAKTWTDGATDRKLINESVVDDLEKTVKEEVAKANKFGEVVQQILSKEEPTKKVAEAVA